jgi:hypothetical protein
MTDQADEYETKDRVKDKDKLRFTNHTTWCKMAENELSRFGDTCTEYITRVKMVFERPKRMESVTTTISIDDGTKTLEVRGWNPALDDSGL